ncbi:hypothetical protein D0T12_00725 [Actinomadura spongiicola]|uniref:Uncharacterized protein n=1 Tax=Actinomadura spongiicola TaxID=2303421 RepID=A0A372GP47_9ACTN|nr:hypothetical protein D0T12_00725 [Actinomadura spongiicola]
MSALSLFIAGQPGATAPSRGGGPVGERSPGRIGAAGSAQFACWSRDRCPADTVSQPSVGQVLVRVVRTLRAAAEPSFVNPHSAGVVVRSMSLHINPGTPTITTRPLIGAAVSASARPDGTSSNAMSAVPKMARNAPIPAPREVMALRVQEGDDREGALSCGLWTNPGSGRAGGGGRSSIC